MNKSELKPAVVFEQFAKINQIPRPSKREEKMIAYLKEWGESRGLATNVDETGNVIIRKPATPGMENRKTVILQSHMDMVCDKLVDVEFDFDKDPIKTYIDGEWLTAEGTTLGADDGIGCAMELALLESNDIEHGPIECVFTRDEETGLSGAEGMKAGFMTGDYLINLDSEDEGEIFVSCAGGRNTTAKFTFQRTEVPAGYFFMRAQLKGLVGGHSGDDINKQRANAIKLLGRFLFQTINRYEGVRLAQFNSGKMHNAIPRDGMFVIAVPNALKENVKADWNVFAAEVEEEFCVTDTQMVWAMESTDAEPVIENTVARNFIFALQAVDNGIYAICQDPALNGMVETSSNIASIETKDNEIVIVSSQRSNVMSNLDNMCATIRTICVPLSVLPYSWLVLRLSRAMAIPLGRCAVIATCSALSRSRMLSCLARSPLFVVSMLVWSVVCSLSAIPTLIWYRSVLRSAMYILLRSVCSSQLYRWYGITCLTC